MESVDVTKLYLNECTLPRTRIPALSQHTLTWLCVRRTQFSNPALEDLPDSLEYLDATRTRINDDGLHHFVRLENLKRLKLRRTPTSAEAIVRLEAQMPWCRIEWEPLLNP